MRLAAKAKAAWRSTLEAMARLDPPREQTVKHEHVYQGRQAPCCRSIPSISRGGGRVDEQPKIPMQPLLLREAPRCFTQGPRKRPANRLPCEGETGAECTGK